MRRELAKFTRTGISFLDAQTQTKAGKQGIAMLMERLTKDGFDEDAVHQIAGIAQITSFRDGQPILDGGRMFPYVIVVLSGTLSLDMGQHGFTIEANAGDHIGTFGYFGVGQFRQVTRVTSKKGGILAGLPWEQLDQTVIFNTPLALKLFSWLGKKGMSLIANGGRRLVENPDRLRRLSNASSIGAFANLRDLDDFDDDNMSMFGDDADDAPDGAGAPSTRLTETINEEGVRGGRANGLGDEGGPALASRRLSSVGMQDKAKRDQQRARRWRRSG